MATSLTPSARGDSGAITLGATNVLTGDSSGYLAVRIPSPATLVTFPAPRVEGNGRFPGFVLRSRTQVVLGYTYTLCWTRACKPEGDFSVTETFPPEHTIAPGRAGVDLPAGDYQLYLIADGAPVTVTLSLQGLTGSTNLSIDRPWRVDIRTITPVVALPPPDGAVLYSGGATGDITTQAGLVLEELAVRITNQGANGADGACIYRGAPPPGGLYLPGCPVQQVGSIWFVTIPASHGSGLTVLGESWFTQTPRDGSRFSLGAWWTGYAPGAIAGHFAVWMDLMSFEPTT